MSEAIRIEVGESTVSAAVHRPADPWASLVLAHGAGAGFDHPFLVGLSDALETEGVASLRFNFPYREAGRKFPDRAPAAIAAWRAVHAEALRRSAGEPVWAAGKSFGGRMASMAVAEGLDAPGLVFLGYPLHPPGKPEQRRDAHLFGLSVPMLFLQGTKDPFASPAELAELAPAIGPNAVVELVEGGNHSFEVAGRKRPADVIGAELAPLIAAFLRARVPASRP
ncbi:alpha/beta family hydrolase [Agromyces seonyuensis]|uniref:Dienelactone hydrolase n=1 Tax=Agromyces seonyuensis TaxID=2662446 RepID=A0A6I4P8L8_9MICO|nr:dienelactone hydrolase [Agromyces seonyuensis]